jgi:hypothetical protein
MSLSNKLAIQLDTSQQVLFHVTFLSCSGYNQFLDGEKEHNILFQYRQAGKKMEMEAK